jgi:hypothetical protein
MLNYAVLLNSFIEWSIFVWLSLYAISMYINVSELTYYFMFCEQFIYFLFYYNILFKHPVALIYHSGLDHRL